jgi:hypothetical protein
VIGRVRLEAHAPITYQMQIVLLTVATVAAGMTVMAPSMIGQSMEWQRMSLVVVAAAARQYRRTRVTRPPHQHRHQRLRRHQRPHQHLRRDVPIHQVIGRVRLEAHAPITYQMQIVPLTVATVAAGMTVMAPSMIGQSMEWQRMLLVVVAAAARQYRRTRVTRPPHRRRDVLINRVIGRVRLEAHAPIT